jgi:hypothetical protein
MKWLKVLIGMKQGQVPVNAKRGYEHINGFAYGDTSSFLSGLISVIRAYLCRRRWKTPPQGLTLSPFSPPFYSHRLFPFTHTTSLFISSFILGERHGLMQHSAGSSVVEVCADSRVHPV